MLSPLSQTKNTFRISIQDPSKIALSLSRTACKISCGLGGFQLLASTI